MKLYIDIDGVLLHTKEDVAAEHAEELIEYITSEFDCYWLTTHCKGDTEHAVKYLSEYFHKDIVEKLTKIKPTYWETLKTEAIDFDSNFIWLEDYPFQAEKEVLRNFAASESLYTVDLNRDNELSNVLEYLKGIKAKRRKRRMVVLSIILTLILSIIVAKGVWMGVANRNIGDFATEKEDILMRRDYLIDKIITNPEDLIAAMPEAVGPQFQGEWALYSASMLSAALHNIAYIYPETREDAIAQIDSLINIVMSPELRRYDAERWGEDPLESLDGDESHVSYLSHLAWMISGYKNLTDDNKYDNLYHALCETMNRRILQSPYLNLETYPGELIYVPDMLVAIVALSSYSKQYGGKYSSTIHSWLQNMQENWTDSESGLLVSYIPTNDIYLSRLPIKGSYSALNCYYLTFIDEGFARSQYEILKTSFLQERPIAGFKEYYDRKCWLGFDIDAGPILCNLSPTGTAFGLGSITYFEDYSLRRKFLRTAEFAGSSVTCNGKRHYMLANIALVGEAITLAMRTSVKYK